MGYPLDDEAREQDEADDLERRLQEAEGRAVFDDEYIEDHYRPTDPTGDGE